MTSNSEDITGTIKDRKVTLLTDGACRNNVSDFLSIVLSFQLAVIIVKSIFLSIFCSQSKRHSPYTLISAVGGSSSRLSMASKKIGGL